MTAPMYSDDPRHASRSFHGVRDVDDDAALAPGGVVALSRGCTCYCAGTMGETVYLAVDCPVHDVTWRLRKQADSGVASCPTCSNDPDGCGCAASERERVSIGGTA